MFLDDKLLETTLNHKIVTPQDVQDLYFKLINMCNDEKDLQLQNVSNIYSASELKCVCDKVFNQWDSFCRMLGKKKGYEKMALVFQKESFKEQMMSVPAFKETYLKLKNINK